MIVVSTDLVRAVTLLAFAFLVAACATEDVSPVDVERQAFEDLRTEIRVAIDDPDREAEAVRLVGVLEADLADLREKISARRQRVRELNANYDVPREEFKRVLADFETEIYKHRTFVSKTRRALADVLTAEEFETISHAQTDAMVAAIKTIQSI